MIPADILRQLSEQGIELDDEQHEKLIAFSELMIKWNKTYNLTAIRDANEVLIKHIVDSLVVGPYLNVKRCLDVGSGGGLPGMPLAILKPDTHFTLLDTNGKKTRFIQQAIIQLRLENVVVAHARVEKWSPAEPFDAIISRAFASLNDFVSLSHQHLTTDGRFYAMKGQRPSEEMKALPANMKIVAEHELHVPRLDATRYLIEIIPHE